MSKKSNIILSQCVACCKSQTRPISVHSYTYSFQYIHESSIRAGIKDQKLRVFWTWFVNIKILQTSSKICEQDLCRLHKNLTCMLPERSKRHFVLTLEQTRIKIPKESWNKSKINNVISFRQRDKNLYLILQIGSWAQKWENGWRNTLQKVTFASSKVRSCCFPTGSHEIWSGRNLGLQSRIRLTFFKRWTFPTAFQAHI